MTKIAYINKYSYCGYAIGFDARGFFSFSYGNELVKNIIIFGVDNSSSAHVNKRKNNILIAGKDPTQVSDYTKLTAEYEISINFNDQKNNFFLSKHCDGNNSFVFVNEIKIYQPKAKDSEINGYSSNLGNTSKDFTVYNMKKGTIWTCVYFSVNYDSIDVGDILDSNNHLKKKKNTK